MSTNLTGIHYTMPEAEYRSAPAIAGSDAKHILPPKTPAHYAAHMAGELKREQSRSMLLGTMAHLAVLEPTKLDAAFVEKPEGKEGDFRTKEGKEWKAKMGNTPILDADEARAVRGIRDSIAAHSAARELLAGTQSEVAMFGEHRTGLWIKGRVDALKVESDMNSVIVDVKTTSAGADANTFARQAAQLNYHVSAAWYCHLCGLNGLPPARFYWVAVEVAAPYAVAVYEIHPDALDLGMGLMNDALDLICACEGTGEWPAYGGGSSCLNLPGVGLWEGGGGVSEWIPADKELPGNPRCVLATDGECHFIAVYQSPEHMEFVGLPGWSNAHTGDEIDSVITHWMELPEVPE